MRQWICGKKADEKILGFYWIVIFVVIAIAVVGATMVFFGFPSDIRQVEAKVLGDRLIDCIAENGGLKQDVLNKLSADGSNLEEVCGVIFSDSFYMENQFYAEIEIEGAKKIVFARDNSAKYIPLCGVENTESYPACYEKKLALLNEKGEFALTRLFIIVNKAEQNLKQN